MRSYLVLVLLLMSVGAVGGYAQESGTSQPVDKPATSSKELDAVREQSKAFVEAFNKADAKAIAQLWTTDGEYIDDSGNRFVGRDAIEKAYAAFFASSPGTTINVTIDDLRQVSPNVVIEDGRSVADSVAPGAGVSSYVAVHVNVDGAWLMASVRDSWVEAPASLQSGSDLAWLIGTWKGEEHGVSSESVCRWIADGHFLERSFTNTGYDGSTSSGVQVIGWNPLQGNVQSWDFSPDGGHAVGNWVPSDSGWIAEMRGMTGDGMVTSSVNVLRRLDDNAFVWQSFQRRAGGVSLPDTDEVVLKRQPVEK